MKRHDFNLNGDETNEIQMSAGPRCPGKEWLFQRQECLEAPYWCCPRGKTNPP